MDYVHINTVTKNIDYANNSTKRGYRLPFGAKILCQYSENKRNNKSRDMLLHFRNKTSGGQASERHRNDIIFSIRRNNFFPFT